MGLWRKSENEAPLVGAPPHRRREKTYSAENGYAYRYVYEGQRTAERDGASGIEFVFSISRDRGEAQAASVFIADAIVAPTPTHRYAIAKVALFRALDGMEKPDDFAKEVCPDAREAEQILSALDED